MVHLRTNGADVEITDDPDRATFRASVGIPDTVASCHTGIVDGYAIEGHVPTTAIQRMLTDRPDIAGLALPGMPADSPGMGGDPASWSAQPVVAVDRNGTLTAFAY